MTTSAKTHLPETQNPAWGFWGTIHSEKSEAWALAIEAISHATDHTPEVVSAFLDSRFGRHFADEVNDGMARQQSLQTAIDKAIERWMTWRIGRGASRDYGIPPGLPYLTGFVIHCAIERDTPPPPPPQKKTIRSV